MSRSRWTTLILVGFFTALAGVIWVRAPGYMDADYYFAIARQISSGGGLNEPFIWTYITNPVGIVHPSNLYWMPLTSLLASLPMFLLGSSFRAAQFPFVLLTALLPLGVARFSLSIHGNPTLAYRSGWLAAFSGFFFPYFLTTDMFILFAWIGIGVFFLLQRARESRRRWHWLVLGLLAGLAHLARADGWLLILPALAVPAVSLGGRGKRALLLLCGYLLIMGPWFLRNLFLVGSPLAPGLGRTLWLTSYEEFFHYPAADISFPHWLANGIPQALLARLQALGVNLERIIAENGLIFLTPLVILGGLKLKNVQGIRLAVPYGLALLVVMTVAFPFAGMNGGIFHSSAAVMPVAWCLAPIGLETVIEWGVRRRGWEQNRARALFHPALIGIAAVFTFATFYLRAIGNDARTPRWIRPQVTYQSVGEFMADRGAASQPVAVNNPPGYWVETGTSAIVIPTGGQNALYASLHRYGVEWVILDANRPRALQPVYELEAVPDWLEFIGELPAEDDRPIRIFKLADGGIP
jgi:hypothetical protein